MGPIARPSECDEEHQSGGAALRSMDGQGTKLVDEAPNRGDRGKIPPANQRVGPPGPSIGRKEGGEGEGDDNGVESDLMNRSCIPTTSDDDSDATLGETNWDSASFTSSGESASIDDGVEDGSTKGTGGQKNKKYDITPEAVWNLFAYYGLSVKKTPPGRS